MMQVYRIFYTHTEITDPILISKTCQYRVIPLADPLISATLGACINYYYGECGNLTIIKQLELLHRIIIISSNKNIFKCFSSHGVVYC